MKRRVLDLCCKEGGASAGYVRAGFEVVGVDIEDQPRYPFGFVLGDALAFLRTLILAGAARHFALIHASVPCQGYSKTQQLWDREHPDLIGPMRELLIESGRPWVMENVEGAPLLNPVTLCGSMFGLNTYRHRLFETGGGFELTAPPHPEHVAKLAKMGRTPKDGEMYHAVGNFPGPQRVREEWGMPWASRRGLAEAIPPVFAEHIGAQVPA